MKEMSTKKNVLLPFAVICTILAINFSAVYGQSSRPLTQIITSGRVNTLGKFSFQYGRLDINVKLPRTADGLQPALWLVGADFGKIPWPDCGGIGLFEMGHKSGKETGIQAKLFNAAAHWGPVRQDETYPNHTVFKTNTYGLQYGAFHLITMIWNRQRIRIYLDLDKLPEEQRTHAKPYFEMEITEELEQFFCKPFSLVINLAAGGIYTGIIGKENMNNISALNQGNSYQAAMYIDYVRVWDLEGKLIFDDEFNGSRIDSTKWNVEANDDGSGNLELQSYRRQNVIIGKDRASGKNCLVLTARRE